MYQPAAQVQLPCCGCCGFRFLSSQSKGQRLQPAISSAQAALHEALCALVRQLQSQALHVAVYPGADSSAAEAQGSEISLGYMAENFKLHALCQQQSEKVSSGSISRRSHACCALLLGSA
jgi:hypothetical protein